MSCLAALLRLDLRLQWRYGFVAAAIIMTLVWLAFLRLLPAWTLDLAVPLVIFTDLAVIGFYLIAALVLYERGEATLTALIATPTRFWEYLASKLATLALLALLLSLVVALAATGLAGNLLLLAAGVVLLTLITSLVGFITVLPFSSVSSFLIPSGLVLTGLGLPLVPFVGPWESPIFYLLPTHGPLLLVGGAFTGIEAWQALYAVLYPCLWLALLTPLARRAFDRHIIGRLGGR